MNMDVDMEAPALLLPQSTISYQVPGSENSLVPQDSSSQIASVPDWISSHWDDENSTPERVDIFLAQWPPSRTPGEYCSWISVDRGGTQRPTPDVEGLKDSFQKLVQAGSVTVPEIDRISKAHNALMGKWLIFAEPSEIDAIWARLVRLLCLERRKGSAKVSPRRGEDRHVICVYVSDYTNMAEVKAMRASLRFIGITGRIGFKPDAYTYLDIYSKNCWNIRPCRYFE
ncbi:translation initiation factor eIF 4e-like domain-containing protein [Crucibulum laeve]|uniref:Translation initiation factor eIF 4e-like domain-containing protein n=1 Tax=Crucibulum laeve TaxID=68775 RepID=A0A5C3LGP3_9AGAR|nr:translation initiation factor eIF 4e-like domain-containing protein [Crucibulum laeve]